MITYYIIIWTETGEFIQRKWKTVKYMEWYFCPYCGEKRTRFNSTSMVPSVCPKCRALCCLKLRWDRIQVFYRYSIKLNMFSRNFRQNVQIESALVDNASRFIIIGLSISILDFQKISLTCSMIIHLKSNKNRHLKKVSSLLFVLSIIRVLLKTKQSGSCCVDDVSGEVIFNFWYLFNKSAWVLNFINAL